MREKEDQMIEALAELEHDQWIAWSKDITKTEKINSERFERWTELWIPYSELSEENKEMDREWARKALGKIGKIMMSKAVS